MAAQTQSKNILLLCTGNICRSPMAEGLMRAALPRHHFFSAELHAPEGAPADPYAISLMSEIGIDISRHRARRLAAWMMHEADWVLVMESAQITHLKAQYPAMQGKLARLGERLSQDIPDPVGQTRARFSACLLQIERAVAAWLPQLCPPADSFTADQEQEIGYS